MKIPDKLFQRALIIYSQMIRQYCFRDYHIENWIMIIDLDKRSITDFPFKELKMLINTTSLFFGGCLHRMFLLNPTNFFHFTFKIVEKIMDPETRVKIQMLKKNAYKKMFEQGEILESELVEEFGGTKEDKGVYWPPVMMDLGLEKERCPESINESQIKEVKNVFDNDAESQGSEIPFVPRGEIFINIFS
jgi:hypothetical protein